MADLVAEKPIQFLEYLVVLPTLFISPKLINALGVTGF